MSNLLDSYRWHRQHGRTAVDAIANARKDVAAARHRYPASAGSDKLGAAFNGGMRWAECPAAVGLRFVGYADKLMSLRHEGYYTRDEEYDSVVRGVVYQLPGRGGVPIFLAGYDNPDNGAADKGGPAVVDFSEFLYGELTEWIPSKHGRHGYWNHGDSAADHDACREAARRADRLAENMAEKEREYNRAWQAGSLWAERGEDIAHERSAVKAMLAERKLAKARGFDFPAICATIVDRVSKSLGEIASARKDRAALMAGDYSERDYYLGFYPSNELRAAFNEGAGTKVLEV